MEAEPTDGERFLRRELLGTGAFGVVHRAFDRELGREVALKTLKNPSPEEVSSFKREFRTLADLRHENLVSLYELFVEGSSAWFTMELIDGTDLVSYVRPGGVLDERRWLNAARQLVEAVAALHAAGCLHRDLKPTNVLVDDGGRVIVLDFGLATTIDAPRHAALASGRVAGTIAYMSPETLTGRRATPAADWYGVGMVLYEAAAGRLPFKGGLTEIFQRKQQPTDPPEVLEGPYGGLVAGLLDPDPARRAGSEAARSVLGPAGTRADREASSSPVVFVGRSEELLALKDAWREAGFRAVSVHGPSGIGKTRLIEEFVAGLEPDALVLRSRCRPSESLPWQALDGCIDALSQVLPRAGIDVPKEPALGRLFPALADATGRLGADEHRGDAVELRRRGVTALRTLLASVAGRLPTLLWIDDTHWAGRDSAALLRELLQARDLPQLLLLTASRAEPGADTPFGKAALHLRETWADLGAPYRELGLAPLSAAETRGLCSQLVATPHGLDELVAETGGNPFLATQLCQLPPAREHSTPTMSGVIAQRLTDLPPAAASLLERIALARQPIARAVVARTLDAQAPALELLDALRRRGLVKDALVGERLGLETVHDRLAEAVIESMSPDIRKTAHLSLAHALEAGSGGLRQTVFHLLGAGARAEAIQRAEQAADEAALALAFDDAARYYDLALEGAGLSDERRDGLGQRHAEALENSGRCADSAHAWLALAKRAEPGVARRQRRRAAKLLLGSGHIEEGISVLAEVLEAVGLRMPRSAWRAAASLMWLRLRVRLRGLRPATANAIAPDTAEFIDTCWDASAMLSMVDTVRGACFQQRHFLAAMNSGDRYRIARALAMEGPYLAATGWAAPKRTGVITDLAVATGEEAAVPHGRAITLGSKAVTDYLEGRWRTALTGCEAADRIYRSECTGVSWELDTTTMFLLMAKLRLGRFAAAQEMVDERLPGARERDDRYLEAYVGTRITPILSLIANRPKRAQTQVKRALERWPMRAYGIQHFWGEYAVCLASHYAGDARAPSLAEKLWQRLRTSLLWAFHELRVEARALRVRCVVGNAEAPDDHVLTRTRPWLAALAKERAAWPRATASGLRGCVAARLSDHDGAASHFSQASALFDEAEMPFESALCHLASARLRADGLRVARWTTVLESLGVADPIACSEAWFPTAPGE